eukprot:7502444-Alexandrium_andersonii.AAC.1
MAAATTELAGACEAHARGLLGIRAGAAASEAGVVTAAGRPVLQPEVGAAFAAMAVRDDALSCEGVGGHS